VGAATHTSYIKSKSPTFDSALGVVVRQDEDSCSSGRGIEHWQQTRRFSVIAKRMQNEAPGLGVWLKRQSALFSKCKVLSANPNTVKKKIVKMKSQR
jgi:hypothetical protein